MSSDNLMKVDIPYPYSQFTDTEFFLTDSNGLFISDIYYDLSDNRRTVIFKSNASSLGLTKNSDIRFTFCHNHNKYHIYKFEQHVICKSGVIQYDLDSPFKKIVDIKSRYRVFYNRHALDLERKDYTIDNYNGKIGLHQFTNVQDGDTLDIVTFYTGSDENGTVSNLPMSGYIYLKRNEIDRNYNNNLMAVFVNGKLIPRDKIVHMSNNIYKISEDINSRYNLDVRNMSPRVNSIAPFYQKNNLTIDTPMQNSIYDFPCSLEIVTKKHNRHSLDIDFNPVMIDPSLLPNKENYFITLIHHGYVLDDDYGNTSLKYNLKFYRDDYAEQSEPVKIVTMLRYRSHNREEERIQTSYSTLLMGKINEMHETSKDIPLYSIRIESVVKGDFSNADKHLDGILCRFQIENPVKEDPKPVYYELTSDYFEKDEYIGVFEWVVSTDINGTGDVLYRKIVYLTPKNKQEIYGNIDKLIDAILAKEDEEGENK